MNVNHITRNWGESVVNRTCWAQTEVLPLVNPALDLCGGLDCRDMSFCFGPSIGNTGSLGRHSCGDLTATEVVQAQG